MARVAASGLTPLEYMLGVMRDSSVDERRRDDAARNAAPYVHPRLAVAVVAQPDDPAAVAFSKALADLIATRSGIANLVQQEAKALPDPGNPGQ